MSGAGHPVLPGVPQIILLGYPPVILLPKAGAVRDPTHKYFRDILAEMKTYFVFPPVSAKLEKQSVDRHSLRSCFECQRSLRLGIAMDSKDFHFFLLFFSKQIESNVVKNRVGNSFITAVGLCLSHPVCSLYTFIKIVYCWAKMNYMGLI